MKKRRPLRWIIGLALLCQIGCSTMIKKVLAEPKIKIEKVDVRDTSLQGTTLVFFLRIDNPNGFALKVDSVIYRVSVNKKFLSEGKSENAWEIPGRGDALIQLPFPVEFSQIFEGLGALLSGKDLAYRVQGEAQISGLTLPFEEEGKIKALE